MTQDIGLDTILLGNDAVHEEDKVENSLTVQVEEVEAVNWKVIQYRWLYGIHQLLTIWKRYVRQLFTTLNQHQSVVVGGEVLPFLDPDLLASSESQILRQEHFL